MTLTITFLTTSVRSKLWFLFPKMAIGWHFGCTKITFDHTSFDHTSHLVKSIYICFTKCPSTSTSTSTCLFCITYINIMNIFYIHLHYIFIDRRRIQGPIWPIRSFSNGTFTFTHHIWIFLRLERRASGILDLYDTIYNLWLKNAGYHTWTTRYKCIYMFIFIYRLPCER